MSTPKTTATRPIANLSPTYSWLQWGGRWHRRLTGEHPVAGSAHRRVPQERYRDADRDDGNGDHDANAVHMAEYAPVPHGASRTLYTHRGSVVVLAGTVCADPVTLSCSDGTLRKHDG